jgi:hypothetical protein
MRYRSYAQDRIPFVSDVSSYSNHWKQWWTSFQPAWRRDSGWPLPRDNEGASNWVKVGCRGQNGLFLIVLSTAWWAYSIRSEEEWVLFDEAANDVNWVISQVISSLKALKVPPCTAQLDTPGDPKEAAPNVSWMVRQTGKRQPKLSRKLQESAGA